MAKASSRFSTQTSLKGPNALAILNEAVSLLRHAPVAVSLIYFMGALPYCLGLIYFIFDMSESADAERHLPVAALLLALLFLWMKTCQAVFSRKLLAHLEGDDPEPWTLGRWGNTALLQTIFAGSFFLTWPLALLILLPFGWVHAFYHNISILATGRRSTLRLSMGEAFRLAQLWPKQNHLILGYQLAGLLFLFLNLAVFFSMIPQLLNTFFGIQTIFDENSSAWNNSSFYLDVSVFCFLILNPLSKAIHVLRCFYGRARLNGADLKAELRRQRTARGGLVSTRATALSLVLILAWCSLPLQAETPAPAAAPPAQTAPDKAKQLDQAIQKTLAKDEFSWRSPRPEVEVKDNDNGYLARFLRKINGYLKKVGDKLGEWMRGFFEWLYGHKKDEVDAPKVGQTLSAIPWNMIFILVLIVVVGCLLALLVRYFRGRGAPLTATPPPVSIRTVDLQAEDVRADALPEDSWLQLAQELMEKGEFRLALRALYLATLSVLAQQQLIRLGPAKSNRDYLLELTRRLRENSSAVPFFRDNVKLFEASWYGTHDATVPIIETMRANHQQVRNHAVA